MNDHLMDPLEWTVRKTISIPKKYYWETGNYDVSFRTKTWHRSVQSMGIALRGAEKVGGFVASLLGLNNSRFDDVTAYMTDECWIRCIKEMSQGIWLMPIIKEHPDR